MWNLPHKDGVTHHGTKLFQKSDELWTRTLIASAVSTFTSYSSDIVACASHCQLNLDVCI
ncbi:hypothetical protein CBOM_07515 [Ceraceosorus bombacis]|uniref:Uncharacterized protein n=1 Tax=Ceraceosorus bombacis TaxID=401625 RepID=A0A0P1BFL1_9BASI|nr:hypothetical protein CBOM_07515 [Ceraceosorus bombacis]